jgi:hypothetical protein
MFGIISSAALREQAAVLVGRFSAATAPSKRAGRSRAASGSAIEAALKALYEEAADYSRERKLSVIGRARLARALQEELRRCGFPADLVSKVTGAVAVNALVKPDSLDKR